MEKKRLTRAKSRQTAQDRDRNGTCKGLLEESRHIHTHPVLHHPGEPSSLTQERTDRRRRRFFTATTRVHPHLPLHQITRASPSQTVDNLYRSSLERRSWLTGSR